MAPPKVDTMRWQNTRPMPWSPVPAGGRGRSMSRLVAAVAGALLAAATIGGAFEGIILKRPRGDLSGLRWIGWHEVLLAMGAMGIVAIVLALIPTLASGRRHLRV